MTSTDLVPFIYFQREEKEKEKCNLARLHLHVLINLPPRCQAAIEEKGVDTVSTCSGNAVGIRRFLVTITDGPNLHASSAYFYKTIEANELKQNESKFSVQVIDTRNGLYPDEPKSTGDHDDGDGFPMVGPK